MKIILPLSTLLASVALLSVDAAQPDTSAERNKARQGKRPGPEAFQKLDANGDGLLTVGEFNASPMAKEDPKKAAAAFSIKDADKNSKLTKEEFAKKLPEGKAGDGKRPSPDIMFKKLDANGDSTVSKAEFNAGHMAKEDPTKAGKAFAFKDADKNGKLTKQEFARQPTEGKRPSPDEMFKKRDADRDGFVSRIEFNGGRMAKENPERAAQAFALKDADKNGKLTKIEFASHLPGEKSARAGKKPDNGS